MAPVTEDRVINMINETLRKWEKDYGDVRHRQNTEKFDQLQALINRAKGAIWGVGSLFTFVFTAWKIYEAMHLK